MRCTLCLFVVAISCVLAGDVALRAAAATGKLFCGSHPYQAAKVVLYRINSIDKSQILNSAETDSDGTFKVEGNTQGRAVNETTMTPVVRIYHQCDEDPKKSENFRRFQIQLPANSVNTGRMARRPFSIGTINLQPIYPAEQHVKTVEVSA